jgi:hypothetical protein
MPHTSLFDAISSKGDLDDLAEQVLAQPREGERRFWWGAGCAPVKWIFSIVLWASYSGDICRCLSIYRVSYDDVNTDFPASSCSRIPYF